MKSALGRHSLAGGRGLLGLILVLRQVSPGLLQSRA